MRQDSGTHSDPELEPPGLEGSGGLKTWLRGALALRPEGGLMLSGLLVLLAVQTTRVNIPGEYGWFAPAMTVLGVVIFLLGAQSAGRRELPGWLSAGLGRVAAALQAHPVQVVYSLTAVLLSLTAAFSIDFGPILDTLLPTVIIWLAGILFAVLGAWQPGAANIDRRRLLVSALALGLLGLLLRATSTTDIPVALTGDEASMGLSALAFVKGEANNIFTIGWFSFPSLFYFMESLSIRIFGQTTFALRLPAALAGALTVAGLYLFGRAMFGRLTGWLAALFLTGFHFHIHFSRLGLNNIWDGLAYVLALGSLWYGWKTNRRAFFILAGLSLGVAQYMYVSSRLLFVLIPAWMAIALLIDRTRLRQNFANLVWMGLVTFVVVAPLAYYFANNPNEFMAPFERVRLTPEWVTMQAVESGRSELRVVADQVWLALKAFTHEPIRAWYVPGIPLLRPVPATLFLLGLMLLAIRPGDMRTWLILLWLVGFGLSAGLSHDTPASQRYVAAAPLAALLVGYGLGETVRRFALVWPERRRLLVAVALVGMAFISLDDARFYFTEFTPPTRLLADNNMVAQRLANILQARPKEMRVFFFGAPRMGFYSLASVPYLAPHIEGFDMNAGWGSPENPDVVGDALMFVFLPDKESDLAGVRAAYPGGELVEETTPDGDLIFWRYEVPGSP